LIIVVYSYNKTN